MQNETVPVISKSLKAKSEVAHLSLTMPYDLLVMDTRYRPHAGKLKYRQRLLSLNHWTRIEGSNTPIALNFSSVAIYDRRQESKSKLERAPVGAFK